MSKINGTLLCTGTNKAVVEALFKYKVDFLLVGGLAVAWYCETRQADDMDILINPTTSNVTLLISALHELGYTDPDLKIEKIAKTKIQIPLKRDHYADILTPPDAFLFEDLALQSVAASIFNIAVRVPSKQDLISLKKFAIEQAGAARDTDKHSSDIRLLSLTS